MLPAISSQTDLFQKSNSWINARYNLPKITEMAVDLLAMQVDPNAESLGTTTITASDLNYLLSTNTVWGRMKDLATELKSVSIEVWDDDLQEYLAVNFFRNVRAQNSRKDGYRITTHWNDDVRGFILHKRLNYTGVSALVKANLNGGYSRRIYELCRQFLDTGWYAIEMGKLKEKIKAEGIQYPSLVDRALTRAVDEINALEICDFTLSFVIQKRRRQDYLVRFAMQRKEQAANGWRPPQVTTTSFRSTPQEWLANLETDRPEEFQRRYRAEFGLASAMLFDGSPEDIDARTRSRMMLAYSESLKAQSQSGGSSSHKRRP